MNLKNQWPVFVPAQHIKELEKLSKAALMDMVWDYAEQIAGNGDPANIMEEFRARREIILRYRAQAKEAEHALGCICPECDPRGVYE